MIRGLDTLICHGTRFDRGRCLELKTPATDISEDHFAQVRVFQGFSFYFRNAIVDEIYLKS